MTRGNRKENIFQEKTDYFVYLSIIKKVKSKYPFVLCSYCLMTNHVHLQIATIDTAIWEIMRDINSSYTVYYNRKYNFIGHLFQGRYLSEIIKDDVYLLQVSRYIHLNPVKAGLVDSPIQYPWSSYGFFMEKARSNIVDINWILKYFTGNRKEIYRYFVENIKTENEEENYLEI